jgi:hypothetical protein
MIAAGSCDVTGMSGAIVAVGAVGWLFLRWPDVDLLQTVERAS